MMAKGRDFRAFDYVNQPYERVRDAVRADAHEIFRKATRAADSRAQDVASGLHVNVGGIEIGAEIEITVKEVEEKDREGHLSDLKTTMRLEWEAARNPRLFPEMEGEIAIYPLTATETQIEFAGRYEPPLGPLGGAIDRVVGHRIAEATIHRFVTDVADYLRRTLAEG